MAVPARIQYDALTAAEAGYSTELQSARGDSVRLTGYNVPVSRAATVSVRQNQYDDPTTM